MAEHFTYHFERRQPERDFEQEWDRFEGLPLLGEVTEAAQAAVSATEQFQQLPERNQKLLLDMAGIVIHKANRITDSGDAWKQNYWGLYVVGSRARGDARPDSDLDLLSVGTFYRGQGFIEPDWYTPDEASGLFDGFDIEAPDELPSEYNVGDVDRKYLLRAKPQSESVLPVDLSVVDLTFLRADLDYFKDNMDVDEAGNQLPRVPLVEVTVATERHSFRM